MSFTESLDEIIARSPNTVLGKHPSWERVRLVEVAEVLNGFAFPSTGFSKTEGVSLIRIRDINARDTEAKFTGDFDEAYLIDAGDILVGMDGDFNCAIWGGSPALLNQRVCKIDVNDARFRRRFLYYALPGYLTAINKSTSAITVKHLSSKTLLDIPLPLPSIKEQDRIVGEIEKQFTRLDAATAALKRVQVNLKRYRASVLKAACEGRLVPTEAELARKEGRDYEPADKLLQRILRERRARWEADTVAKMRASGKPPKDDRWKQKYKDPAVPFTTNLPSLPEGWCWASLEQLISLITSGSRGWGDSYAEVGPLFVRAQDIKTDSLKLDSVAHVDLPSDSEGTRTRIFQNDLLVTITGANVTKAALVTHDIEEAYVSQHVGLVRPVLSETAVYLYSWIISPSQGRRELLRLAYGAGKPGLNLENLRTLLVALPPIEEQARLASETERLLSTAIAVESSVHQQAVKTSRARIGILQHAFTGQLVAQDPTDEPASALLERIRAERGTSDARRPARRGRKEPVIA